VRKLSNKQNISSEVQKKISNVDVNSPSKKLLNNASSDNKSEKHITNNIYSKDNKLERKMTNNPNLLNLKENEGINDDKKSVKSKKSKKSPLQVIEVENDYEREIILPLPSSSNFESANNPKKKKACCLPFFF